MLSSCEISQLQDSLDGVPSIGGNLLYLLWPSSSEDHIILKNTEILALQMEQVIVRNVDVMDF